MIKHILYCTFNITLDVPVSSAVGIHRLPLKAKVSCFPGHTHTDLMYTLNALLWIRRQSNE